MLDAYLFTIAILSSSTDPFITVCCPSLTLVSLCFHGCWELLFTVASLPIQPIPHSMLQSERDPSFPSLLFRIINKRAKLPTGLPGLSWTGLCPSHSFTHHFSFATRNLSHFELISVTWLQCSLFCSGSHWILYSLEILFLLPPSLFLFR